MIILWKLNYFAKLKSFYVRPGCMEIETYSATMTTKYS